MTTELSAPMTMPLPVEIAPQLSQARAVLEHHLAGVLEAVHLFGSAVDGGLKPASDIDLMVTVRRPLEAPGRQALMKDLLSVSSPPGAAGPRRPLEVTVVVLDEVVPWRYPPRRELQFGEWLREDLQAGLVEPAIVDRDLAILLTKVRQHSITLFGAAAQEVFDAVPQSDFAQALLDTLEWWHEPADWQGDERNVVLALARIWFSASTGDIAPKDVAAAWALERLPTELRPLLERARYAYLGTAADDLGDRPVELVAFVRYMKEAVGSSFGSGSRAP